VVVIGAGEDGAGEVLGEGAGSVVVGWKPE
jgi:hypothetical protein